MRRCVLACAAGLASVVMTIGPTLAADPFVGTWMLDAAKSSYSPGPAPAAAIVTTRDVGNGKFDTTIDLTEQNGKVMHFDVTYANDGVDYPIAGSVPDETASSRYVGAETLESTLKIGGRSIMTTTEVMAEDSNTLTSTTIGTTQSGTPIRNVQVYERK